MLPYRSREEARAPNAAPQTGLVADMVRQFADVHAFVRELVQNGIDAGATSLDVAVDRDADGMAAVRVTDDGCGMTMSVVEDALLVLFRSTKDEDATKIGKYGVGFMSVFAIEPSEVIVDTWRDGDALRVRLFPDHTYEITRDAPRAGSGTTVTLHKPVAAHEFEAFWMKVAASLHRWCRHAAVPIQLHVLDAASGSAARSARVDTALDVRAQISVRQRFDDMEIVVGPGAGTALLPETGTIEDHATTFAGFYNRGLLLHETNEELRPGLADVRVKVNSPRLRHTLSRDDVRRDEPFLVALKRAERMVQVDLRAAVLREIARESAMVSALTDEDLNDGRTQRLYDLCDLATKRPLLVTHRDVALPIAHPVEGAATMLLDRMAELTHDRFGWKRRVVLTTTKRAELTAALAARGVPLLFVMRSGILAVATDLAGTEYRLIIVDAELVLARENAGKERLPGDDLLCAWLSEALAPFGAFRVAIGTLSTSDDRVGVLVPEPEQGAREHVVRLASSSLASKWPKGSLIVLREDAEPVACARRATSPSIGAHLLARYLLLNGPGLPSKTSEALALRALAEIR